MRKKELLNFKDGKLRNLNEKEFSAMNYTHLGMLHFHLAQVKNKFPFLQDKQDTCKLYLFVPV